ncbi:hypothetical protein Sjap_000410 [Stephania japonica]|uniref:TFIIS N-terminal domain-containing protein n=1 Tax=Stephania japonica TaxID=461633 RepID=A0AAP0KIY4_9MAGN
MKELWDIVAGPDSHEAEKGKEDNEINQLFKLRKKRKKNEKSAAEIALQVEHLLVELQVTAEEDAELNRQSMPAVNKLKKLPLLTELLSKRQLQQVFLDHGALSLLKNWLEPLPDGSLPNSNVRAAILNILNGVYEETATNRKLAKDLVDKWSRPIFSKSTRFEDLRYIDEERAPYQRPAAKKPVICIKWREDDIDLAELSRRGKKSVQPSSSEHVYRPEASTMDYVIRPHSKIDSNEVRERAKLAVQSQHRLKIKKKLQQLKAPANRKLQAIKISVQGRGMVNIF